MQEYLIKIAGSSSFLLRASRRVVADSDQDAVGLAGDFLATYRRVSTAGLAWDTWSVSVLQGRHSVARQVDSGSWRDFA